MLVLIGSALLAASMFVTLGVSTEKPSGKELEIGCLITLLMFVVGAVLVIVGIYKGATKYDRLDEKGISVMLRDGYVYYDFTLLAKRGQNEAGGDYTLYIQPEWADAQDICVDYLLHEYSFRHDERYELFIRGNPGHRIYYLYKDRKLVLKSNY